MAHEEFYNISADPECLDDLLNSEKARSLKQEMRKRMDDMLREQNDPRILGNGAVFDTYGYSVEHGWNFYERYLSGELSWDKTKWVNPSDYEKEPLD